MSKLHDPDLPAGAVVRELKSGSFQTSDGRILQRAKKKAWYVLMTVYDVQTGELPAAELHARNRRIWNGWMCQGMTADERAALAKKVNLKPEDLDDLTQKETEDLKAAFAKHLPGTKPPDPTASVDLSETHFSNTVVLEKCVFRGPAVFRFSTFSGSANFANATFSSSAYFVSATFIRSAIFTSATFSEVADFNSATFSGSAHFSSATFSEYADFSDGAFKSATTFKSAQFKTQAPKFFQREMHQDTTFTTDPANWPAVTAKNAEDGKQAYTRLRQMMNDLHKPDDEHFFFRQEMRCKAILEPWPDNWVIRGYGLISDFGNSVMRPLIGLGGLIVVVWPFVASFLKNGSGSPSAFPIFEGLGISIGNTLPFLGFVGKMHPDFYKEAPAWLDAMSGAQSVAGIALLFFLGLGLRNRFRLK